MQAYYELADRADSKQSLMTDFFNSLPDNPEGGLSADAIRAFINEECTSWD